MTERMPTFLSAKFVRKDSLEVKSEAFKNVQSFLNFMFSFDVKFNYGS